MKTLKVFSVVMLLLLFTGKMMSDARMLPFSQAVIEQAAGENEESKETEPRLAELYISVPAVVALQPVFVLLDEKQIPLNDHFRVLFYPPIQTPPPNQVA
ncbi:hypothetical protein [Pedobacter sp. SYP-B3415]|uniref:hypothetical protein n=1 Tax=Pedobacter sp. SYP-B3415 TaxID=2496641 RepID=UPI00101B820A|nr:hypothetical protein [Pedobacter sp. SYP-B3415]